MRNVHWYGAVRGIMRTHSFLYAPILVVCVFSSPALSRHSTACSRRAALSRHYAALSQHCAALSRHSTALSRRSLQLSPDIVQLSPDILQLSRRSASLSRHCAVHSVHATTQGNNDEVGSAHIRICPSLPLLVPCPQACDFQYGKTGWAVSC